MALLHVDLPRLKNLVEIPGEPVWPERPPYTALSLRRRGVTDWVLCPVLSGTDDADLVGDLVVPCELPGGGFEKVFLGRLLLSPPFAPEDLATLRQASDELRILMTTSEIGEGRLGLTEAAMRAASARGLDVGALVDLSWAALAMRQWPRRKNRQTILFPTGVMRGMPDEPATFREAVAGRISIVDGEPEQSVRHLVAPTDWKSARLGALLLEAATELENANIATSLVEELTHLAVMAKPLGRRPDIARSAWPLKFRVAWEAALALLTVPRRAPGHGVEHQPLQEAWTLFQDWITLEVIHLLSLALGPYRLGGDSYHRRVRPKGEVPFVYWVTADFVVDLWVSPMLGSTTAPKHLEDVYAASLKPDLLLVRRPLSALDSEGKCPLELIETFILDAKRYSGTTNAPGVLTRGDVVTGACKYMWSIRSTGATHRYAIDQLVLISPGGGPTFLPITRTQVVKASPGKCDDLMQFLAIF